MKKFLKMAVAVMLAATLMGMTACGIFGGGDGGVKAEKITLTLNGGKIEGFDSEGGIAILYYEPGEETTLPVPTKENYDFEGWHKAADFSDAAVTKISAEETGSKFFYAKWTPKVFEVTLHLNGGTLNSNLTQYTYGKGSTLPTPVKAHSTFGGWYDKEEGGNEVTSISATDSGNKEFWAKWDIITHKLTLVLDGGTLSQNVTSYVEGEEYVLPIPEKVNHEFKGWFAKSDFSGSAVTKIGADETGEKTFYAKWEESSKLQIETYGGYEEGAYVEFTLRDSTLDNLVSKAKVYYKSKTDPSYPSKAIDGDLVRAFDSDKDGVLDVVRADIVGVKAGEYTVKVKVDSFEQERDVTVTAYDRSGYAHFDSSTSDKIYDKGVGGYKNDGTPKNDAVIVYVDDNNKNTVKLGSYTGIVEILANAKNLKTPLIVRVIGKIGAATWKSKTYTKKTFTSDVNNKTYTGVRTNETGLAENDLTYNDLLAYNQLDTTKATVLNNLTNKALYDVEKSNDKTIYKAHDSYWNMCDILSAENVTIEGIGTDAELFQWGLTWKSCNSIEVRNLTFQDYPEDACSFEGSKYNNNEPTKLSEFNSNRIWLHHNNFNEGKNYWDICFEQDKHEGDGATDFKRNSYVTVAYNHYYNNHKTGLVGGGDTQPTANITFHHNYYDQCWSRLPLGRMANMHMYNNYYKAGSSTSYFTSLRANAFMFAENCYYDTTAKTVNVLDTYKQSDVSSSKVPGYAKLYNCTFAGKVTKLESIEQNWAVGKYFKVVSSRTESLTAQSTGTCTFGHNFDTDASKFYYSNGKSNVTRMDETSTVPTVVPQLAGVHKK